MAYAVRLVLRPPPVSQMRSSISPPETSPALPLASSNVNAESRCCFSNDTLTKISIRWNPTTITKASAGGNDGSAADDGVSLGTMKLPPDTDLARFEILLLQWANSLCQGADLPLPVPLKIDKIPGGARLGFITIGDGKTEVLVYIDCFVSPASDNTGPIFQAIRNGPTKDQTPPGEPRIMRSLLSALKKSVELARL